MILRKTRIFALASAAMVTVCTLPASVSAQSTGPITAPIAKPVQPLSGNISAYYGNINAFYGNINAFSGTVSPFYGNINAFWGNINPFYGNINAFWGNINPFYGNINALSGSTSTASGYLKPSWGNINAFWGEVGPQWGNINAFWGNINAFNATAPADYATLATQLNAMVDKSRSFWGSAVQSQTGKAFDEAFAQPMLAKWSIDLSNPASLAQLSEAGRQRFMLDWYDQLMNFSGTDHVDWWMKGINWTPALTTALGSGVRTTIGILDFSITGDATLTNNITKFDGISTFSNGHGTAVASLIVSPQDGKGVMGIAPMAQVIAYNPFDATGTANWADVTKGVGVLLKGGASVINMSLGVPGYTLNSGWNGVFIDPTVKSLSKTTTFVIAAGNDGLTQTENAVIDLSAEPNFVLVGSVDPTGTISSFSNRPGTACMVGKAGDKCDPRNALMTRFIVAPGEMILVSDGQGGVTRMSGTSFAAPLVSGAITLIQNRWPWLQKDSKTTLAILLGTAKDLGAPGIDPVYGVGELDVARAVQPLDSSKLQWKQTNAKGDIVNIDARIVTQATDVQKAKWEADGVYYYLFEDLTTTGNFRDFGVPLSTKLFGQTVKAADGTQQQLADWLYKIYVNPNYQGFAGSTGTVGFTNFSERGGAIGGGDGLSLTMTLAPRSRAYGYVQSAVPYQTSVRLGLQGGKAGIRMGFGDGAVAVGGRSSFGMISDYDVDNGGANPLLGMASGGAYGNFDVTLTDRLTVSAGYTQKRMRRDARFLGARDVLTMGGRVVGADAQHVAISYRPLGGITLNAGFTRLTEDRAVLAVQSVDPSDFAAGAATAGVTLGADVRLPYGFGVALTGTRGTTRDRGSAYRNLSIASGGLVSSAYEVALTKEHLLDRRDRVRIAVSQPMHVDNGRMNFTSVQVIDRNEGTLGVVTQSFDLPTPARQYVGEVLYGRTLSGLGDVSLFGRAQLRSSATPSGIAAVMAGTRLSVGF